MMASEHETSERTCVGCRRTDGRDALLRFVLMGEPPQLVPDVRRRAKGRGVSVHPSFACVAEASRRGAFKRAFRRDLRADASELAGVARVQYQRRVDGLIVAARRSGKLVVGGDAVAAALRDGKLRLLVVADDASDRRRALVEQAERLQGRCVVFGTKQSLGELLGRSSVAVVAVTDDGIATEIRRAARGAADLAEDA